MSDSSSSLFLLCHFVHFINVKKVYAINSFGPAIGIYYEASRDPTIAKKRSIIQKL